MEKLKKNLALVVGLAIPVVMVLIIALVIYIPRWFTEPPRVDFIYAVGEGVYYPQSAAYAYPSTPYGYYPAKGVWPKYFYQVVDGKLVRKEAGLPPQEYTGMPVTDVEPKFYLYHVAAHTSVPISFEDTQKYTLDTSTRSPDGWEIAGPSGGGGIFPFFYEGSYDYNAKYLKKGSTAIKLNLNLPREFYGDTFLAWVVQ
jgi:hypothetical protein